MQDKMQSVYQPNAGPMKMDSRRAMPAMKPPPKTSGVPFKPRNAAAKVAPIERSEKRVLNLSMGESEKPKRVYKRAPTKGR